jgi:hypothetical protein
MLECIHLKYGKFSEQAENFPAVRIRYSNIEFYRSVSLQDIIGAV